MKMTGRIVCSLLVGVAVAGTTVATAQEVTTYLDVQYCSRYVWRGTPANGRSYRWVRQVNESANRSKLNEL
jgi:hypothetical protein